MMENSEKIASQTCNDLRLKWRLSFTGIRQVSNAVFFELQGGWRCVPTHSIRWLDCSSSCLYLTPFHGFMALPTFVLLTLTIKCIFGGLITLTWRETLRMLVSLSLWSLCPNLGCIIWPTRLHVFSVLGGWNGPLTCSDWTLLWRQAHRHTET